MRTAALLTTFAAAAAVIIWTSFGSGLHLTESELLLAYWPRWLLVVVLLMLGLRIGLGPHSDE